MRREYMGVAQHTLSFVTALDKKLSDDDFRYIAHTAHYATATKGGAVVDKVVFHSNKIKIIMQRFTVSITADLSVTVRSHDPSPMPLDHKNQAGVFALFFARGAINPTLYVPFDYTEKPAHAV